MYKKSILILILFVFVAGTVFANSKIRVTSEKANIRVRPTTQSAIIITVPLGAMLDVVKKQGNWFLIKLPLDEKGIPITGYVHQSIVEIIEEIKQPIEPKKEALEKEKTIAIEKKQIKEEETTENVKVKENLFIQKVGSLSEKERYFMETDPYYPVWREKLDKATREVKKKEKLFWIGGAVMVGGYLTAILGPKLFGSKEKEIPGDVTSIGVKNKFQLMNLGVFAGTVGTGIMGYALFSKGSKSEKVAEIQEEGIRKGYILSMNIVPVIDPRNKIYALSFTLSF